MVVDASALPSDTVRVNYRDVLLHPLYGRLEVNDQRADRASRAEWEATVLPRIDSRPQGDRRLVGSSHTRAANAPEWEVQLQYGAVPSKRTEFFKDGARFEKKPSKVRK